MKVMNALGFGASIVIAIALLAFFPDWLLLACLAALVLLIILTRVGRQTALIVWVGMGTLPQRLGSAMVVVIGIAGVVGVLVGLLAMGDGFERTLKQTGTDDTVLIVNTGAQSETGSALDGQTVAILSLMPQVLKNAQGRPLASPEQILGSPLTRKSTGLDALVSLRGVGEHVWELWPNMAVTGRRFKPGLRELLVGKNVQQSFRGVEVGSTLTLNNQPWTIVGTFDSGNAHNSELWGDAQVIGSVYRLDNYNSLTLRLTDASAFQAFKAAVAGDPRLKVDVYTTRQFYNRQSERFSRLIGIVGATIGALMAIGATFGALNATYTAVATRGREIATLRAIGFRRVPVLGSVVIETMLLATFGGAIGGAMAWIVFDGIVASTAGDSGQVMFALDVSPELLYSCLKWALAIGFIGGLFPALYAAHRPIATSLRAA